MIYSSARPVSTKSLRELTDLAIDAKQAEEIIIDLARKDVDLSNL